MSQDFEPLSKPEQGHRDTADEQGRGPAGKGSETGDFPRRLEPSRNGNGEKGGRCVDFQARPAFPPCAIAARPEFSPIRVHTDHE